MHKCNKLQFCANFPLKIGLALSGETFPEFSLSALCLCFRLFRVDPIPYDTPKPAGHTRFVCVSDTHSRTDGIQMPYGDVLLHMGDFTELGLPSEVKKFNDWLGMEQPRRHCFTLDTHRGRKQK